jgi:hypothetical protein
MTVMKTIGDVARLIRSKNAGPFWQTLDIFCDTDDDYETLAAADLITPGIVGALYGVDPSRVQIFRLPTLRALKISFPRPVPQGGIHDRDIHAGQQHVPLMRLKLG